MEGSLENPPGGGGRGLNKEIDEVGIFTEFHDWMDICFGNYFVLVCVFFFFNVYIENIALKRGRAPPPPPLCEKKK